MSCSIYHFFEYLFVCNYHFEKLSFDSKIKSVKNIKNIKLNFF